MLILRRKKNESILIGDNIRLTVIETAADGVRIAIDAPKHISILREELSHAEEENRSAVAKDHNAIFSLQSGLLQSLSVGRTE
jgi:carbon storage regulator